MNKTTSIVLAAVIVVVCLGIGAAVVLGGGSNDKSPDAEFTYVVKEVNAYETSTGYVKTPADGTIFAMVGITITVSESKTLTPGVPQYELICDGKSYKYVTYENGFNKIEKGESGKIAVLYEIPKTFTTLSLKYTGTNDIVNKSDDVSAPIEKVILVEDSIKWDCKFVEDVTSFPRASGYGTETADSGKHFIVIQVIEKNVSYTGADYQPSMSHFKLKGSDNIVYDYSLSSTSYSDDNNGLYNITLGTGTSKTYHIVYEIPTTTSLSSILYNQSSYVKYLAGQDDTLLA